MEEYIKNVDGNSELEDSEEVEDLDVSEEDADSVLGKKQRIQMINIDIKKLLEEREELERQIEDLEDDLESND